MGNPIQYRNPNNIHHKYRGGLVITRGGFRKTAFIVMVRPPGAYLGGVNENFSPAVHVVKAPRLLKILEFLQHFICVVKKLEKV